MRAAAFAIGIAVAMVSGVGSQARSTGRGERLPSARARATILAFDACVQERFDDVDRGLGFTRIVKPDAMSHRFKPENLREDAAVRDLERERLQVVLYLAGRRVLQPDVPAALKARLIKGPVEITRSAEDTEPAPAPLDLQADSRRAMLSFANGEGYDFTVADWTFIARPVRASTASCLECHAADGTAFRMPTQSVPPSSLRVGDPLGVVLYGYRSAR